MSIDYRNQKCGSCFHFNRDKSGTIKGYCRESPPKSDRSAITETIGLPYPVVAITTPACSKFKENTDV